MATFRLMQSEIAPGFVRPAPYQHIPADAFPTIHPIHWLHSHFAVGGWSPLSRLSGMLTAHMTRIAPRNGFTWHPHRGLEIYTWVLEGEVHHEDTTGGAGVIGKGELQRMFAGDYIEHQELNPTGNPARVIQIWYIADRHHQGVEPHYQQLSRDQLPAQQIGDGTVYRLIGDGSPMKQHMTGRLSATILEAGGTTTVENPREDEDLFLYVTDGAGRSAHKGSSSQVGQYDVILARPDAGAITLMADGGPAGDAPLEYMSFYLPRFLA